MYLSACIEWLFKDEHPDIADRVRAAHASGLSHVEFHLWRDKPIERLAEALQETGVKLTGFVVEPRRSLVDPAQHAEFLDAVRDSIATAVQLGSPPLVIASGFIREGVSQEEHKAAAVMALKAATRLAEEAGVDLLLEPLNDRIDHPGMYLCDTRLALDIIEEVGSPALGLLFDAYHSAVMEENLEEALSGRMHLVRHVQIADLPGRNEPGTGKIDWRDLLARLKALRYEGGIGLEYKPSLASDASLAMARATIGL